MSEQNQESDVVVIGAGPAGLTAAIYCAWLGLKTVVLEAGIVGGKAWLAPRIENFPGFEDGIKGSELTERMTRQASRLGGKILASEEVVGLNLKEESKIVVSRNAKYMATAVIIATGTQRKKLQAPGESEFLGRGISYCTVCDGPFFRNAKVAVVGGGEEAAMDALHMSEIAESVTVVVEGGEAKFEGAVLERLKSRPNVQIVNGKVTAIEGKHIVEKIKILEAEKQVETEREVRGVFIALGGVPMTQIAEAAGIKMDSGGCLSVDRKQKTSIEGVFAAGDCTCGGKQVVTAAGEGATAGMSASVLIKNLKADIAST
jgi:thioredoxin reductase (NADPH)